MSEFIRAVYNARNNLLKQIKHIGYDITNYESTPFDTVQLFVVNQQSDMLNMVFDGNQNKAYPGRVFVHYFIYKTFKPNDLYDITDNYRVMHEFNAKDNLIIVCNETPNDTIIKKVKQLYHTDDMYIVLQNIQALQFFIHDHVYVPPHILLDEDETEKMKERFNITSNDQMPELSRFDPVASAILLPPDRVCKILRPNVSTIVDTYYRFCVNK